MEKENVNAIQDQTNMKINASFATETLRLLIKEQGSATAERTLKKQVMAHVSHVHQSQLSE